MNFRKSSLSAAILLASVTMVGCGSSSSDPVEPPANTAPTDITLTNTDVNENEVAAVVGSLSATDADSGDTFTFTTDNDMFTITGSEISLADGNSFNFEEAETATVSITVTDNGGLSFNKEFTLNVIDQLDTYTFDSKIIDGESSVSYSGQTARQALIAELAHYIGNVLQGELDDGTLTTREQVIAKLDSYFRTTEEQYDNFPITFIDNAKQSHIATISSSHKNLLGKLAGNDASGQHKMWNDGDFEGWGTKGSVTPTELIDLFFGQLADNAQDHIDGIVRTSVEGSEITKVYLNTDGTDLQQLIQKFLLMAVTYSQATDDYLGHETDGKGLTTDNISAASTDGTYTNLEHQFDEGFGYFGAARDYLEYNDNEISSKVETDEDGRSDWNGEHDTDGDDLIDLKSEINFGQSVNAAKRDRGTASNTNPTDFTQTTMEAFLAGRELINANVGMALSDDQMETLKGYRDVVVDGWERAIAATVVHYINDTHADLATLGTDDFNYADAAKHYSELKGFALGLQFNPYSKITDEQYAEIHTLIGDAPVLSAADVADYQADLIEARDIIEAALSFDSENVQNW